MKLGAYLKNKREQSGITLKEMQEKSGLRKDIIRMIEAGDLKALPEPRHAPFLLRQYTEAVGLDYDGLSERFSDEIPEESPNERKRQQSVDGDYQYFKKVLVGFLIMVGVLFAGWMVLLQIGSETDMFEEKPIYEVDEDAVASSEDSEEEGAPAETVEEPTDEPTEEPTSEPVTDYAFSGADGSTFYYDLRVEPPLTISLSGDSPSWVSLTDDADNTYAYESLTEGEYEISPDADILYLTLGDATDFEVSIDGEPLENPRQGDSVTVYYEFNLIKE
ncbi:helix-turn-helix domain-containing protein [Salinicoccus roseus]|uniref:helix-turn-helix domain-containing protein n=1 Tax=Salinicoccus roseus TaxID=45670 RepID=UPI003DA03A10